MHEKDLDPVWVQAFLLSFIAQMVTITAAHSDPISLHEIFVEAIAADSEAALRKAVSDRLIGGLLVLKSLDESELVASGSPRWQNELRDQLTQMRVHSQIRSLGLTDAHVADAFRPFALHIISDCGSLLHSASTP